MSAAADQPNPVAQNTEAQQQLGYGPGVSGGPGICQTFSRGEDGHSIKTVTFTKTYIHFMGPGTEYVGAHMLTDDNNCLTYGYDFGGSIIPFNYSRAAARPHHLWPYMQKCNSYRLLGHSVHLSDLICSRDEIQADGRIVTTPQIDCIEVFHDTQGKFRPNNIVPVGTKSLFELNHGFRSVEPETIEEATLPRAKIQFPSEHYNSTKSEMLTDFELRCFNVYNGMFTIKHWNTGETYDLSHTFDSGRIPVGSFAEIDGLACNKNRLAVCNTMLDTVWGIQANMATQVNRYPIQPPKVAFFRFAPYWTANGKAQRRAQFKATYKTTIEFHFSPDIGIEMFQWGSQPEIHSIPQDDPYDQARAAVDRFNWAVHAEDFVMPLTGYVNTETESHMPENLDDGIRKDKEDAQMNTLDARVKCTLRNTGFDVSAPTREDGYNLTTVVSSGASDPSHMQLAPELSAPVMAAEGFSQKDIEAVREAINANPPVDEVVYDKNEAGLIVDEQKRPILPVEIKKQGKDIYEWNDRFYRPAQAWEVLGVTEPPVWTKKDGGRFIPWPKFGKYGRLFGNNLCQIRDIEEVKRLNKIGVAQKMDVANRVKTYERKTAKRIRQPVENVKQSQPTLPLMVRGLKSGPKFPAPTVPDVNEDYDPLFAAWFSQEVEAGNISLPSGWTHDSFGVAHSPTGAAKEGEGAEGAGAEGGSPASVGTVAESVWSGIDDLFVTPRKKKLNYYGSTIGTQTGVIGPTCEKRKSQNLPDRTPE